MDTVHGYNVRVFCEALGIGEVPLETMSNEQFALWNKLIHGRIVKLNGSEVPLTVDGARRAIALATKSKTPNRLT